ncbi:MAG: hypothetical protein IPP72_02455 [Chitinophagaceae bacterium]|nr:hypothetical protein [Chitinophagaceae bacterium]
MHKKSFSKKSLFNNYPSVINCTEAQLSSLFNTEKGRQVNLQLPGNLNLQGTVISKADKYNNLQTVAITLPAFRNILFSVTKRYDAANKAIYVGHLFNTDYADGYELKRNTDNTYQFIKIATGTLLPTCNQ